MQKMGAPAIGDFLRIGRGCLLLYRGTHLKKINLNNFEPMGFKLPKKAPNGHFSQKYSVPRRSRVNSKLVRTARNFFVAGSRVHEKKLLGMGTGYQLPPTFCTWGLKVGKSAFCAKSGALWRATYYRCGESFPRTLLRGTPATKH